MSSKAAQALARARNLIRRNWRHRSGVAFTNTLAGRISADSMSFRVTGDANWLVNTSSSRSFSYGFVPTTVRGRRTPFTSVWGTRAVALVLDSTP